jgi:hypothetical protein
MELAEAADIEPDLLHFFVGLFTLGFWWFVWLIIGLVNMSPPKCTRCGSNYNQKLAVQTAARLDSERRLTSGR